MIIFYAQLVSLHSNCLCTTLRLSGAEVLRRKKHRHAAVWVRSHVGQWFDRIKIRCEYSKVFLFTVYAHTYIIYVVCIYIYHILCYICFYFMVFYQVVLYFSLLYSI